MQNNQENEFISGIYNYCDHWCEHCKFTARCFLYEREQKLFGGDDLPAPGSEEFVRQMSGIFAETKQMLLEAADERGIDLDDFDDDESAAAEKRIQEKISREEILQLAESYIKKGNAVLKDENLFDEIGEELKHEMFPVIHWYLFQTAVNVHSGLRSFYEYEEEEDEFHLEHADGTIKVALIGINRSITTWSALVTDKNREIIQPLVKFLKTLCDKTEKKFPNAYNFVRPGFDEIETVM